MQNVCCSHQGGAADHKHNSLQCQDVPRHDDLDRVFLPRGLVCRQCRSSERCKMPRQRPDGVLLLLHHLRPQSLHGVLLLLHHLRPQSLLGVTSYTISDPRACMESCFSYTISDPIQCTVSSSPTGRFPVSIFLLCFCLELVLVMSACVVGSCQAALPR